jgi:hypothetical protein
MFRLMQREKRWEPVHMASIPSLDVVQALAARLRQMLRESTVCGPSIALVIEEKQKQGLDQH